MEPSPALPPEHPQRGTSYLLLVAGFVLLVIAFITGISDNPLAIVSMLLGLFALSLGTIYFFAKSGKRKLGQQTLYWAPRALCLVGALFLSMFALDVFGEERGLWETLLALTLHLIPTFLLVVIMWVSWRREWIAGVLFPLLGAVYIVWAWNKPFGKWPTLLLIAGPPVLTGALFLLNWRYRAHLRGRA